MMQAMPALARVGLALVAVLVAAWFALAFYQAKETGKAGALVGGAQRLAPGQTQAARSALDSAGTLNPDRAVDVLRGELAIDQHDYPSAIRLLSGVTASEPLNLTAWVELGIAAAKSGNGRLLAIAGRHAAALLPPVKSTH
jgi:Flp pilus assembly protein TadD